MLRNILIRLLQAVLVLLGAALLVFIMLRIIPGNPAAVLMGEHADTAVIEKMTKELGLDQPVHVQLIHYLAGALRGDFGTSYSLGKPVSQLMASAFSNTLILALMASAFAWLVGIISGIIATVKRIPSLTICLWAYPSWVCPCRFSWQPWCCSFSFPIS